MIVKFEGGKFRLTNRQYINLLSLPIREKRGVTANDLKRVKAKALGKVEEPSDITGKKGDDLAVMLAEAVAEKQKAVRKVAAAKPAAAARKPGGK